MQQEVQNTKETKTDIKLKKKKGIHRGFCNRAHKIQNKI
jgi:hypothetical protein